MSGLLPERFVTSRLRFEALRPETTDVLQFYDVGANDPDIDEVTEYVTWDPHATPKETLEYVESVGKQFANGEGASYLIRPREGEDGTGEIAGGAGCGIEWDRRTMILGTWLRKPFWGRGYSGERAAAFMELAFGRLDLELVAVDVLVDNEKSIRAIEKYVEAHGGRREGTLRNYRTVGGEPVDVHRYSVSREEWATNRTADVVRFSDEPAAE